jgi:fibronectin-binding autotransporter adhesin
MSRFRNLTQITLFALLVLGGAWLGLKLFGSQQVRAAHAVPVAESAGQRTPYTPNSQAIIVTNADNEGGGSLRFAIVAANLFQGPDTIVFDPAFFNTPRTITLSSGELSITDSVTITGPGANLLTLSGNKTNRIFKVAGGNLNVAISGLTISNGLTGQFEGGGGIFSQSNLTLTACGIVNNVSVGSGSPGGGVSMGGAVGTFTGCTFSGNTAGGLGGAVILGNASGAFTNCTISGNKSNFGGGGIALLNTVGERTLAVTNCTVANNNSPGTGGILVEVAAGLTTSATLRNTIIANNTGPNLTGTLGGVANAARIQSSGNNLTSDNSNTFLNQATDQINKDPLLGPLQNNGGPTQTHALLAGSPALDKGGFVTGLTTDQRGASIPFDIPNIPPASTGDHSDIGAVEMQAIFVTNANDSGAGSLRQAVASANSSPNLSDILFDPAFFNTARTITLTSELSLNTSQTINGPGANLLTLSGNNASRVFNITGSINVAISGLTISNGKSTAEGGGIRSTGNLTVTACAIVNNAAGTGGGGVYLSGPVGAFTDCTFSGNTANLGGGVDVDGLSATFTGCTLSGNTATSRGGGIYFPDSGGTIINSTISGNTAVSGGGINLFNLSGNHALSLTNCTVVNNIGTTVGGLNVEVTTGLTTAATLRNTIIANNSGLNLRGFLGGATNAARIISQGFNLTNDNSNTFLNQATDILNANPQLGPLQKNGGPTPTHALLAGSPALDKGNSAGILLDQRGRLRSFDITTIAAPSGGDQSDIGAVEMQAVVVANANDGGAGSLRQAIADSLADTDIIFSSTFFNIPRTITFSSGEILINKSVTITGPGANLLTLSGNNTNRIFNIAGSAMNVAISGLTIGNGMTGGFGGGGGIFSESNLTLTACDIVNNVSVGSSPGGGVTISGAVGTFISCTFRGNLTSAQGGGVFLAGAIGTFTGCTFSGNTATDRGGAVELNNSSGTFTNCTVSGNKANFGGGLQLFNTVGERTLAVTNCTVVNNTSPNTGGINVAVTTGLTTSATLRNTIIANNTTNNLMGTVGGALSPATIKSQGYNLTSDNSTTFLNQATDITNANPQLGPLQNNGGPTQTHALLANSPALDKGNSAGIPLDQRGRLRSFDITTIAAPSGGDQSDIGAVEMQAVFVTNIGDTGAGSLRAAITTANANGAGLDDILFDNTNFSTPSTINLLSALPDITSSVTINGPGANLLTVRRPDSVADFRIFRIVGGITNGVSIRGLTISNGKATGVGGGIASDSNLTLATCSIINNAASEGGGGVYIGGAVGTFTDCTFTGNMSGTGGGAVRLIGATATFSSCTFSGNSSANYFSAVSFTDSSGTMTNCTISGNTTTATGFGSVGLYITSGIKVLAISSCTIANNTSTNNAGVYVEALGAGEAAATLHNTIVANNAGVNIGRTAASGGFASIVSRGYNLTNDVTNTFLSQATDIVNANPQLGPLQNNGGLTQTRALLFGSPAIDKGSSSGVATDQRGVRRPVDDPLLANATGGDGADIGAFERGALAVVSAANFKGAPLAQESIVALFGENLTGDTALANSVPLPFTLANTSVSVRDAQNTARSAPLFFASPFQLNFQIPPGTVTGAATISLLRAGNVIASTNTTISAVEPALFTANASGTGLPAAVLFRVRNGVQTAESITAPIDLGPPGDVTVLVLYGTGFRKRTSLAAVTMKIGGVDVAAGFADAAPGFIGLDQLNTAVLPRSLAGKGLVNLELTVDGKPANLVQVNFK